MRPAGRGTVAVADDVLSNIFVLRKSKIFAVVDGNLEALIVDDCPFASVAVHIGSDIWKV